ncbi:MAG: hypothetical protein AABW72_04095 [archaeon]
MNYKIAVLAAVFILIIAGVSAHYINQKSSSIKGNQIDIGSMMSMHSMMSSNQKMQGMMKEHHKNMNAQGMKAMHEQCQKQMGMMSGNNMNHMKGMMQ